MKALTPGDPEAVRALFDRIASRYDPLNDLLSLGLHRIWKREAVLWIQPKPGQKLLDLCCGTGDLALLLAAAVRPGGRVLGLDAAAEPLKLAARRSAKRPWLSLEWRQGDALATGIEGGWADGAVIAYGLRNLADPGAGLRELRRVLRPGGRAAVLDFNRQDPQQEAEGLPRWRAAVALRFQQLYLRRLVVPLADLAGIREEYAYLEPSLLRFPTGRQQEQLALEAGFSHGRHCPLAAGQMGMLQLVA
jgi:ubiquinone/menaquinone biosynthesis methyltransferase